MSDIVIKAENLGKKYIISHQGSLKNKRAFRDYLGGFTQNLIAKGGSLLSSTSSKISKQADEEFWALKDLNFEVKQGDVVGIIGRNGAGKSTLIKLLSRITEPSTGRVSIKGRVASLLEVGTGFHPELTGRENIYLNGSILGMSRIEIKRRFDEIVEFADVSRFLDTPVKRYSSGMYVRLAFSVAVHMEPEILIVDEVLAVGDAEFQAKCLGKMNEISKQQGRTVILVSHNMGTIMQLCKSCILLKSGMIEQSGEAALVIPFYHKFESVAFVGKEQDDEDLFIRKIETVGSTGQNQSSFSHSEQIRLRMTLCINRYESFQNIEVSMLTRQKNRVFTSNQLLRHFADEHSSEVTIDFIVEGDLIAPNEYSFTVILNNRVGTTIFHQVNDVCTIRVYDNGTDLASVEGSDNGCIILSDQWETVNKQETVA